MEEIKSSFKPIDKLIESFIEPVYIVRYLNYSGIGKKLYKNEYGDIFELLYVCSSIKIAENKMREILNTKFRISIFVERIYYEHTEYCKNKCSKFVEDEHKLLEYVDFIITKDKYGNDSYKFDKLKENCSCDVSTKIAKQILLDNSCYKSCGLEVIKTELCI